MKIYDLTPQEKNNFCACSCLQAILRKYRKEIPQQEIARNLIPSEKGFFINDERIKEFLKKQGFDYNYFNYNKTPFNEPDMVLKENADILIGVNAHTFLLIDFPDPDLKLLDPKNGSVKQSDLYSLMKDMHEKKSGGFGLVKRL